MRSVHPSLAVVAVLLLIAIVVAPFHGAHATAASRDVCVGAADEAIELSKCCGEGCTCTPDTCACSVSAPTREPGSDDPIPAPSRTHRVDLTSLPAAHPTVAVGDACHPSARAHPAETKASGGLGGRVILLQSGVLRT